MAGGLPIHLGDVRNKSLKFAAVVGNALLLAEVVKAIPGFVRREVLAQCSVHCVGEVCKGVESSMESLVQRHIRCDHFKPLERGVFEVRCDIGDADTGIQWHGCECQDLFGSVEPG